MDLKRLDKCGGKKYGMRRIEKQKYIKEFRMEYRNLGRSGIKVSVIGMGGNNFGGIVGERESVEVIQHALDMGINLIDTADCYSMGGRPGGSEEIVGKSIKGRRREVVLATKFGMPMGNGPNDMGGSRAHIIRSVEDSLGRLGTDYIDIYYMHVPDPETPIEETLTAMDDLVRSGKVRYTGCCNFRAWQVCEALWTSRIRNLVAFSVAQANYNLLERSAEVELGPFCREYGVGFAAYRPLAEGFLTGKYQRGKDSNDGTRLNSSIFKDMAGAVLNDKNFDRLEKLQAFAEGQGHRVGELAVAWLLSRPWMSTVIAAASRPEQVSANIAAAEWRLTDDEKAEVDRLCPYVPGPEFSLSIK